MVLQHVLLVFHLQLQIVDDGFGGELVNSHIRVVGVVGTVRHRPFNLLCVRIRIEYTFSI